MRADAPMKADGIVILEGTWNLFQGMPKIAAKAAYLDSVTGMTHGMIEFHAWSEETIQAFQKLIESAELDIIRANFQTVEEDHADTDDPTKSPGLATPIRPPGLGDPQTGEPPSV